MKGFFEDTEEQDFVEQTYSRPIKRPKVFDNIRLKPKNKELDRAELDQESGNLVTTPCQCKMKPDSDGFFCDRHKCLKSASLHTLCQTKQSYFDLWEQGRGPLQDSYGRAMQKRGYKKVEIEEEEEIIVKKQEEEVEQEFFMNDYRIPSESRGLGDTIAKITKVTGIKKAVDTVFNAINKDCGCTERQSKLNKMFPYGKGSRVPKKTKGFFE
jgi:hypothetical protein